MIVHARFRCDSVLQCENQATIKLEPVTRNNQGNEEWSRWTPTVTVPETAAAFVPGKIYAITFEQINE